jgi:hypothetical protein
MPSIPRLRIPERSVYISPMVAKMREVPARRVIARSDVNSAIMLLPVQWKYPDKPASGS